VGVVMAAVTCGRAVVGGAGSKVGGRVGARPAADLLGCCRALVRCRETTASIREPGFGGRQGAPGRSGRSDQAASRSAEQARAGWGRWRRGGRIAVACRGRLLAGCWRWPGLSRWGADSGALAIRADAAGAVGRIVGGDAINRPSFLRRPARPAPRAVLPGNRRRGGRLGTAGLQAPDVVASGWVAGYCFTDSRATAGSLTGSPREVAGRSRAAGPVPVLRWQAGVRDLTAAVGSIAGRFAGQAVSCEWVVNDLHAASSARGAARPWPDRAVSGRCMAFSRAVSAPGAARTSLLSRTARRQRTAARHDSGGISVPGAGPACRQLRRSGEAALQGGVPPAAAGVPAAGSVIQLLCRRRPGSPPVDVAAPPSAVGFWP
jgi:hypothetical protein